MGRSTEERRGETDDKTGKREVHTKEEGKQMKRRDEERYKLGEGIWRKRRKSEGRGKRDEERDGRLREGMGRGG